ncbi:MAG: hypothetical protein AB4050_10010 [Synechococcus sp.]
MHSPRCQLNGHPGFDELADGEAIGILCGVRDQAGVVDETGMTTNAYTTQWGELMTVR